MSSRCSFAQPTSHLAKSPKENIMAMSKSYTHSYTFLIRWIIERSGACSSPHRKLSLFTYHDYCMPQVFSFLSSVWLSTCLLYIVNGISHCCKNVPWRSIKAGISRMPWTLYAPHSKGDHCDDKKSWLQKCFGTLVFCILWHAAICSYCLNVS